MAPPSFFVSPSANSPHETIQHRPSPPTDHSTHPQLRRKEWTITSDKHLQALHINVPGVVFIDCDEALRGETGSLQSPPLPAEFTGEDSPATPPKLVAKIVVSSDSCELVDLLEVAPLLGIKEDKGIEFRVKNQNADVQGTILTQIFVSEKEVLREFEGHLAEYVLGEDVLVRHDAEADVTLVAQNADGFYLSSVQRFSLRSLESRLTGGGHFQLQVPSVEASKSVSFSLGGQTTGVMAIVSTEKITAGESILLLAGKRSQLVLQTPNLTAEMLMVWSVQAGDVKCIGSGSVTNQVSILARGGNVDTSAIVAETASVGFVWSGNATVQATKELRANAYGFGSASVEYVRDRPAVVTSGCWFRWTKLFGELVKPAAVSSEALQPYKLRDVPLRKPKQVHIRVTKPHFGKEPKVEKVASFASVSRITLLTGAAAFATIAVFAARRK